MEKTYAVEVIRSRVVTETITIRLTTEAHDRVREFAWKLAANLDLYTKPDSMKGKYKVVDDTSKYEAGEVKVLTPEEAAKYSFIPLVD